MSVVSQLYACTAAKHDFEFENCVLNCWIVDVEYHQTIWCQNEHFPCIDNYIYILFKVADLWNIV